MAEKRDAALALLDQLVLTATSLVGQVASPGDTRACGFIEAQARAVTALARAIGMMIDVRAKEDNMSVTQHGGDEARVARADELRAEIERRLARIRAELEDKSVAEEAGPDPA